MTPTSSPELLAAIEAAIEAVEDPAILTIDTLHGTCIQAGGLIACVVDFLESNDTDPELLGLAKAADRIIDLLIQTAEIY